MVGNIIFIRFQALVAAGIVSMFAVVSLPALSQDTEGEGESNLIESTITGRRHWGKARGVLKEVRSRI